MQRVQKCGGLELQMPLKDKDGVPYLDDEQSVRCLVDENGEELPSDNNGGQVVNFTAALLKAIAEAEQIKVDE